MSTRRKTRAWRGRISNHDADIALQLWGVWWRAQFEQVGCGPGAIRAAEECDAGGAGAGRAGTYADRVLAELLALEQDPEHEIGRTVDAMLREDESPAGRLRFRILAAVYRGLPRRVNGATRWEFAKPAEVAESLEWEHNAVTDEIKGARAWLARRLSRLYGRPESVRRKPAKNRASNIA